MYNCTFPLSQFFSIEQYVLLCFAFLAIVSLLVIKNLASGWVRTMSLLVIWLGAGFNAYFRLKSPDNCVHDPFPFFDIFHFNVFDVLICLGVAGLVYSVYTLKYVKR